MKINQTYQFSDEEIKMLKPDIVILQGKSGENFAVVRVYVEESFSIFNAVRYHSNQNPNYNYFSTPMSLVTFEN